MKKTTSAITVILILLYTFSLAGAAAKSAKPAPKPARKPAKTIEKAIADYTAYLRKNDKNFTESIPGEKITCQINIGEGQLKEQDCVLIVDETLKSGDWASVSMVLAPVDKAYGKDDVMADGALIYLLKKDKTGWLGREWFLGSDGPFITPEKVKKYKLSPKTLEALGWYVEE